MVPGLRERSPSGPSVEVLRSGRRGRERRRGGKETTYRDSWTEEDVYPPPLHPTQFQPKTNIQPEG
ncbi:hypothetical protein FQN60_009816, partial [Etheostoma spectabile]